MGMKKIRNFAIIAHIDHGKTTLTDRMLEVCGGMSRANQKKERVLDSNPIEQERGITIKLAPVSLGYNYKGEEYELNLIDTPGHVDFNYEVERSLAACEGAVLLVDATKGVQAQTVANLRLAEKQNLVIVPVINKIDAALANVEETEKQIKSLLGEVEIVGVSAKTGEHVEKVIEEIIEKVPEPMGDEKAALRGLVFNSVYNPHLGVLAFVRIVDGELDVAEKLWLMKGKKEIMGKEVGVFGPEMKKREVLGAGEVGYLATGLKDIGELRVGDTLTKFGSRKDSLALEGYRQIRPNVYMEVYPIENSQYQELLDAVEKLKLADAALTSTGVASTVLGQGVRMGFLGLLHAEITRERLEREFNVEVNLTSPGVEYRVLKSDGELITVNGAAEMPDPSEIDVVEEPMCEVILLTNKKYVGGLMGVMEEHRGEMKDMKYLDEERVELNYKMPLIEVIVNLHDEIKSVSSGYASLDYRVVGFEAVELVKLTVKLNYEEIPPLATLVVASQAESRARRMAEKLKKALPRHQFEIPIQIYIGGTVVARETVKAFRKDVTAKLYGGDATRRTKLLDKQKKGKKKMKEFGKVSIPQEAFLVNVTK